MKKIDPAGLVVILCVLFFVVFSVYQVSMVKDTGSEKLQQEVDSLKNVIVEILDSGSDVESYKRGYHEGSRNASIYRTPNYNLWLVDSARFVGDLK